jgi:hypothetical protein
MVGILSFHEAENRVRAFGMFRRHLTRFDAAGSMLLLKRFRKNRFPEAEQTLAIIFL